MTGDATTLYDRLDGKPGIRLVVDDFYDRLIADDLLGEFFADADLDLLRETQTEFLCEAAGGPQTYSGTPVREAHLHVPFEPEHITRAVDILEDTLTDHDVAPADATAVIGAIAEYEADLLATDDDA